MKYTAYYTEETLFGDNIDNVFIKESMKNFENAVTEAVNEQYPGWKVEFVGDGGTYAINDDPNHFELSHLKAIQERVWSSFDWVEVDYSGAPRYS